MAFKLYLDYLENVSKIRAVGRVVKYTTYVEDLIVDTLAEIPSPLANVDYRVYSLINYYDHVAFIFYAEEGKFAKVKGRIVEVGYR